MKFKVGDRVTFLNEAGAGEIIALLPHKKCMIKTDDGFEIPYDQKYLVPLAEETAYNKLSQKEEAGLIKSKLRGDKEILRQQKKAKVKQESRLMEVDLHIYELIENTRHLTSYEMLQIQLKHFRHAMSEAKSKKIYKLILIHGVGEGVLRSEIRHALRKYEHIEFGDADYTQFGYGATQVIFKRWD